jgi:hypothetical protein
VRHRSTPFIFPAVVRGAGAVVPRRTAASVVAIALGVAMLGGCSTEEGETVTGCEATVAAASTAVEVDDQIRLLDTAFVRCRSYEALVTELEQHPGIVGYEIAAFVERRCDTSTEEALTGSPACERFVATTVAPSTDAPQPVFVGETLDGRRIELRPDADTPFAGEYPEVVQRTVDIATESGCPGVLEQRDLWAARVDEPQFGDEASVYANHAENVATFIGCEFDPIAG